jgi:hypothetical protein
LGCWGYVIADSFSDWSESVAGWSIGFFGIETGLVWDRIGFVIGFFGFTDRLSDGLFGAFFGIVSVGICISFFWLLSLTLKLIKCLD